ncbi:MAG: glycosyltransferase, partial [Desulfobacterales bacterium]|nr:glycosyltransferase [Desulfobacterales bacterium]
MLESHARDVFLSSLDEVASNCLRYACMGIYPPRVLRGRLSGVYLRPRFLYNLFLPFGNIIKTIGFRRLCRHGWFKYIYLLDEYLFKTPHSDFHDTTFYFLPDPWAGDFSHEKIAARKALEIPEDKFVFLSYGIGDRRKGLHLIVDAMENLSHESPFFLLCAGRITKNRKIIKRLEQLKGRGLAITLNRYVSDAEEELCFCASDAVILPYIKHFGSSGVLSRAAASGTMSIVSDEGLIAKRTRDHNLGLLFQSGNVKALKKSMEIAVNLPEDHKDQFRKSAFNYAGSCSRKAFTKALLLPYLAK